MSAPIERLADPADAVSRRRRWYGGVALVGLAALGPVTTSAQSTAAPIPDAAYAAMKWRLVGPFRGGRSLVIEGIPGDPATFYFGGVGGGVWRSRDGGTTWDPLTDGQPFASIGALAIAPSDPNTIYVGSGEADMRSDITYGLGMWKSTDAGAHWQSIGLRDTRQIGRILIDPHDPNLLLVAALGHAYGPTPSGECFGRPMAVRIGARCCTATSIPARSIWLSTPAIRTSSMPRSGRRNERPGVSIRRTRVRAADCTSRPTKD